MGTYIRTTKCPVQTGTSADTLHPRLIARIRKSTQLHSSVCLRAVRERPCLLMRAVPACARPPSPVPGSLHIACRALTPSPLSCPRSEYRSLMRESGPSAFMRGLWPRVLAMAPASILVVSVYELIKRLSRKPRVPVRSASTIPEGARP